MRDRRPAEALFVLLMIAVSAGLVASGGVHASDGADVSEGARATYAGDDIDDVALYVEDFGPTYDGPHDGVVGNLGPPAYPEPAQVGIGHAHLAVPVYPWDDCPQCSEGFRVRVVHVLARVDQVMELGTRVELIESVRMSGCPVPPEDQSEVIVEDEVFGLEIETTGWYDISVPLDGASCAYPEYRYFIGYWPCMVDRILVDAEVSACPGWINIGYGTGWVEQCYQGDVIVFAEVDCCFQPVHGDESSWGSVKALFEAGATREDQGP